MSVTALKERKVLKTSAVPTPWHPMAALPLIRDLFCPFPPWSPTGLARLQLQHSCAVLTVSPQARQLCSFPGTLFLNTARINSWSARLLVALSDLLSFGVFTTEGLGADKEGRFLWWFSGFIHWYLYLFSFPAGSLIVVLLLAVCYQTDF